MSKSGKLMDVLLQAALENLGVLPWMGDLPGAQAALEKYYFGGCSERDLGQMLCRVELKTVGGQGRFTIWALPDGEDISVVMIEDYESEPEFICLIEE